MSAILSISLSSIIANWRLLQARHAKKNSAAVVKADSYGLGMAPVAHALHQAGCKIFFVATLEEGIALHNSLSRLRGEAGKQCFPGVGDGIFEGTAFPPPDLPPQAGGGNRFAIYVFHGVGNREEKEFTSHELRPVLNSLEQIARWKRLGVNSALHIDTGMNRLGLSAADLETLDVSAVIRDCNIDLLMSHLACGSEPQHPLNQEQLKRFESARKLFPSTPCSLANSSGHFLNPTFHYDLGRPGCSLYGITPNSSLPNPMAQVATLTAPIIQIRHIDQDGTIGYGATVPVKKGMKTATVALGYADGLQRLASNKLSVWMGDHECKMLGRVSMDMTCYDVSHIPAAELEKVENVTLIGPHQTVDDVAKTCGTIGYEIFTRIGNRVRRIYD